MLSIYHPLFFPFLKIQLIKREHSNRNLLLLVHFKYRFNIIKSYLIDNLMIYPPPYIDLPSLALTFSHKSLKKAKRYLFVTKKNKNNQFDIYSHFKLLICLIFKIKTINLQSQLKTTTFLTYNNQ